MVKNELCLINKMFILCIVLENGFPRLKIPGIRRQVKTFVKNVYISLTSLYLSPSLSPLSLSLSKQNELRL